MENIYSLFFDTKYKLVGHKSRHCQPGTSPFLAFSAASHSAKGWKKLTIDSADISRLPVKDSKTSGHGLLDPSLSISAKAFPASVDLEKSHRWSGLAGYSPAILHKLSAN